MNKRIAVFISAIAGVLAASSVARAEDATPVIPDALFATVNGKAITQKEFHNAFNNYLRETFYHQQVPQDRVDEARKEAGERLIDRTLVLIDAKRRGLVADEKRIGETIAEYDARYAVSQMWQKNRETMLPGLKQQLAEQDLLGQMEAIGHKIDDPTDEAVRAYYKTHPELFTEPEKLHVHTILLKVDPSAPKALWDAARDEAGRIVARLRSGAASFEELASLHSQDRSADQGGNMGYVHRGMIPEPVQAQIDASPLGTVADPIDVLEGVAIFRLDERVASKLQPFENVATRARELLKRDATNQAWKDFLANLRKGAEIKMIQPPAPAVPVTAKN